MVKNYVVVAFRALKRQKLYSTINIAGLALGLACCLLLGLFVVDELSFDRMHTEGDRIFRIARISLEPDGSEVERQRTPYMPMPAGPALVADLPEVERTVRFQRSNALIVRQGDQTREQAILFADPTVLDVFTFRSVAGTQDALARRDAVVLSTETAERYFGDADPVGQTIEVRFQGQFEPFVVTGVAEVPANSTVTFEMLVPYERYYDAFPGTSGGIDNFKMSSTITYVQLREGASLTSVEAKMDAFIEAHYGASIAERREKGHWTGEGAPIAYYFQPLHDIHLDPTVHAGLTPPSNPLYAQILAAIALGVLLIACINFMTLAVGRSTMRAKEVGVRKTMGAHRRQLLLQFWGEALLMSTLALVLGIALAALFLPTFNAVTEKALSFGLVPLPTALAALVGLILLTGIVAGSYPALLLARLRPVESLRDRVRLGGSHAFARSLVVMQFALSIFLLAGTFVLGAQLRYVQDRDLGYDRDHLAVFPLDEVGYGDALGRFRTALAGNTAVTDLTGASLSFGRGTSSYGFRHEGAELEIVTYGVEADFIETMEMDLVAGRDFNPDLASDSTDAVVINEALVQALGWASPSAALGHRMPDEFDWSDEVQSPVVVGVVRDFNFRSLHTAVEPALLMLYGPSDIEYALARLAPNRTRDGLDALEAAWAEIAPGLPFDPAFLNDDLAAFYESEARWAQIVRWSTLFALLVACLGLFGLASLAVAQRTKELGIRKVLGATVPDLTALVARGFAALVVAAIAIAAPLAWLAADRWLSAFAYRIDLGPGLFLLAGGVALAVALATVGVQAFRAAAADPVRALRHE